MIETANETDRARSTRRFFVSDGFIEFEVAITMRQDRALPDEPTDLRITGEMPQNGQVCDTMLEIAARLNRHRCGLRLPEAPFDFVVPAPDEPIPCEIVNDPPCCA